MPYIKQEDKKLFDEPIRDIIYNLIHGENGDPRQFVAGEINYILSKIIWCLFDKNPRYATANELMGVLQGVQSEFYRRKVGPYEDEAIAKNGDI